MRYFTDTKLNKHIPRTIEEPIQSTVALTSEQARVIEELEKGNSVVVDSCIGSGKTLVIQEVCNHFPGNRILYLTYNRLLKLDAQEKILNRNTTVQNYHGFVYSYLSRRNLRCSPEKQIKTFLERCSDIPLVYDIICIDEYQDLEEDTADLLLHISQECPRAKWVFVGDMSQKIYDKTKIDVYKDCIDKILPEYTPVQFTKCFRISAEHANMLSNIWEKKIDGVNEDCNVAYTSSFSDILDLLDQNDNKDILILGPRYGLTPEIVNMLERHDPNKYNKSNVWTSIRDRDENTQIQPNSLIVTTYDGCKGMERKVCVVIDWHNQHYKARVEKPFADKQIITNLFCVAASRGKGNILFYIDPSAKSSHFFNKADLATSFTQQLPDYNPSSMFDFKFQSDLEDCMKYLTIEDIPQEDTSEIITLDRDENIDLTPCVGMYQEINFFKNFSFEVALDQYENTPINSRIKAFIRGLSSLTHEQMALTLASLNTQLFRYIAQATDKFISESEATRLYERIQTKLNPKSTNIQVRCHKVSSFTVSGRIDYVDEGKIPWELKFVSRFTYQHYLQAAMYTIMYGSSYAYLWNTKHNQLAKVSVRDVDEFLDQVYKTITLGRRLRRY